MPALSLEFYVPRSEEELSKFADSWEDLIFRSPIEMISVTRGTGESYSEEMHLKFLKLLDTLAMRSGRMIDICSHVTLSHFNKDTLDNLFKTGSCVSEILALTGDQAPSEYAKQMNLNTSSDLLDYLSSDECECLVDTNLFSLNAACYPIGHRNGDYSYRVDLTATLDKIRRSRINRLISQWSLDQTQVIDYAQKLRKACVDEHLPYPGLTVGYMPIKDLAHAERVGKICQMDEGPIFKSQLGNYDGRHLHKRALDDFTYLLTASASDDNSECIAGVHLFTMNNLAVTKQLVGMWDEAVSVTATN